MLCCANLYVWHWYRSVVRLCSISWLGIQKGKPIAESMFSKENLPFGDAHRCVFKAYEHICAHILTNVHTHRHLILCLTFPEGA